MAEFRTTLRTCGARPVRIREASSRNSTSRTQNARFSIAQRLRHSRSNREVSA
jgi:hypothetical protein